MKYHQQQKQKNTTTNSPNEGKTFSKTADRPEGKGTVATVSTRTRTQTDFPTTGTKVSTVIRTTTGTGSTMQIGAITNQRQEDECN